MVRRTIHVGRAAMLDAGLCDEAPSPKDALRAYDVALAATAGINVRVLATSLDHAAELGEQAARNASSKLMMKNKVLAPDDKKGVRIYVFHSGLRSVSPVREDDGTPAQSAFVKSARKGRRRSAR